MFLILLCFVWYIFSFFLSCLLTSRWYIQYIVPDYMPTGASVRILSGGSISTIIIISITINNGSRRSASNYVGELFIISMLLALLFSTAVVQPWWSSHRTVFVVPISVQNFVQSWKTLQIQLQTIFNCRLVQIYITIMNIYKIICWNSVVAVSVYALSRFFHFERINKKIHTSLTIKNHTHYNAPQSNTLFRSGSMCLFVRWYWKKAIKQRWRFATALPMFYRLFLS